VWLAALVYLWNSKGRYHFNYDTISVALTSLEMILVIGGVFGFTYFKFVAEKQAKDAAETWVKLHLPDLVKAAVPDQVEKLLPSAVRRKLEEMEQERNKLGIENSDNRNLQETMNALDDGEKDEK
jgi:hypothetical protein